jgi:hypothetical protein
MFPKMHMKRSKYIKSAVMGAGLFGLGSFPYQLYAGKHKKYARERVTLVNTGSEVSRMALGTGTGGWNGSVPVIRKVLEKYQEKGKAVIQTKVFGAGDLVQKRNECLQFALRHSCVDSFTTGIDQAEQLTNLIERIPVVSVRG